MIIFRLNNIKEKIEKRKSKIIKREVKRLEKIAIREFKHAINEFRSYTRITLSTNYYYYDIEIYKELLEKLVKSDKYKGIKFEMQQVDLTCYLFIELE